jgi:pyruvate dehydrogenase E2 component (dihydrolipoamide acetyltransferase)
VEAYVNNQPGSNGRILASPKARRLAKEQSFDLQLIKGSGPNGAVLADDVLAYQPIAAVPVDEPLSASAIQTGMMWRRMAQRLTESWQTVPHFYLKRDVNAEAFIAWRNDLKSRSAIKITYTDLLVRVVAGALRQHPYANGQWNGEGVIFNEDVNIGLAVAVDDGLLVPVIHNADTLGITALAQRRQEIVERAQSGKLKAGDLQGGTFTISNLGMFGIDEFSAIVNPPQAAILAVGNITDRIVPVDGQAVVKPMMTLSLSCDHRAVDGARGARFLDTIVYLMNNPLGLLD